MGVSGDATGRPAPRRVAVLGAGLMGSQIGVEYALGGWTVEWIVRDRTRGESRVEAALALAREHGLAEPEDAAAARERMVWSRCGDRPNMPVDVIVESLTEDLELKAELLGELAAQHPRAVLASNTSSISITALGRAAGAEDRMVGAHYWNPPLLMPLVEVVGAEKTGADVRARVVEILRGLGKRPVVLRREVPGLLWNRLQLAVLRESLWLVEQGVADPATIDEVMRDGLARRWRLTGPFETVALGGAPTFDAIAENLFPVLSDMSDAGGGFGPHAPKDPEVLAELRRRRDRALGAELSTEQGATARDPSGPQRHRTKP